MIRPSAARAILILQAIADELGPDRVAYWVMPNTVLTLAGARGLCDGVFYHPDKKVREAWQAELKACQPVLERQVELLYFAVSDGVSPATKDAYVSYDLLHRDGLRYTLERSKLIPAAQRLRLLRPITSAEAFGETFVGLLAAAPRTKAYDPERLHHTMSGILLGYPDKAIVGLLDAEVDKTPVTQARIKYADYYACPQPVYDYPKTLATIPAIKQHEKLWSTILADFYTSEFHQKLARNPAFQKRLTAIIKY